MDKSAPSDGGDGNGNADRRRRGVWLSAKEVQLLELLSVMWRERRAERERREELRTSFSWGSHRPRSVPNIPAPPQQPPEPPRKEVCEMKEVEKDEKVSVSSGESAVSGAGEAKNGGGGATAALEQENVSLVEVKQALQVQPLCQDDQTLTEGPTLPAMACPAERDNCKRAPADTLRVTRRGLDLNVAPDETDPFELDTDIPMVPAGQVMMEIDLNAPAVFTQPAPAPSVCTGEPTTSCQNVTAWPVAASAPPMALRWEQPLDAGGALLAKKAAQAEARKRRQAIRRLNRSGKKVRAG